MYVPEGIYDRGGRRDNIPEAHRVVELIAEHINNSSELSLGVVAFSVAQSEAIDNHLEEFRRNILSWSSSSTRVVLKTSLFAIWRVSKGTSATF